MQLQLRTKIFADGATLAAIANVTALMTVAQVRQGAAALAGERLAIYNLAPPDVTSVRRIAALCVAASPHKAARIEYGAGIQGWPGDVPVSRINPDKLAALGFSARYMSEQGVQQAASEVARAIFGTS